ncbi:MAG TPA: NfeD family protein [Planctomycetota bacterium]|nr:NfeD family protein [Planctomycetota bacterium]
MDLWLIFALYLLGLGLITAEAFLPGLVIGLVGAALVGTSTWFGFERHWMLGAAQLGLIVVVGPAAVLMGLRRMALKTTLESGSSFAAEWTSYDGKEGESVTELRPAGAAMVEGRRLDVVTSGEMIPRGARVRVVKVEGNRIVVRAI